MILHKNRNISFEYPKNPYLNQATQKILAKIFPLPAPPQSPKIENFKSKKIVRSSLSLEIWNKHGAKSHFDKRYHTSATLHCVWS